MTRPRTAVEGSALRLLREALGPKARVRPVQSGPARRNSGTVIELMDPSGRTNRLRLIPWGGTLPRGKPGRIVWIIARSTPNQRQRLRARGDSFVDLSGAVRLQLPNLVIDRTDLRAIQRPRPLKATLDPFADRSSRVVRVLLNNRAGREWGVRELAQEAGIDVARASRVVRALRELGVLSFVRVGRAARVSVEEPEALLDLWTGAYSWTRNVALAVQPPIGDPRRFLRRLRDTLQPHRWGLTLQAGAAQVAPHASWERAHVYVALTSAEELASIAADAGWSSEEDGRLVLMMPFYRTSVWDGARDVKGVPVVSDLQLVLDLWHYPLRGREQAEHILDTFIRPIWHGGSR